ncbi:MAG: hypothetical protein IKZ88_04045 [Neisseriaceae bacterium]|nr:hypothetical protein [Neisseriaceae bacterium]
MIKHNRQPETTTVIASRCWQRRGNLHNTENGIAKMISGSLKTYSMNLVG